MITRRNGVAVLMSIELILNAANINFIAFSRFSGMDLSGHIFSLFVIILAAAEAAVALAIILNIFNNFGSINIDEALMNAANIKSGEKVHVVNINNGERLITYVINGKKNSGEITLNGPAARKVQKGDEVIIISYALVDFDKSDKFKPTVIFPSKNNSIN